MLSIFMLFAGQPVSAASVSKGDAELAHDKKKPVVTHTNKKPQAAQIKKDSRISPGKKRPKSTPEKRVPSQSLVKQPRIQTPAVGYCCSNGVVQSRQVTSGECKVKKGSWYNNLAKATSQCQPLTGFCITKNNKIVATDKKRCDQLRGNYYKNRAEAQNMVVKNQRKPLKKQDARPVSQGFCTSQGKVIPNITQLKCTQLKGAFYNQAHLARLALAKEKQQKQRALLQPGTQIEKPAKPVQAIASVNNGALSALGQNDRVGGIKVLDKNNSIRDPLLDMPEEGLFKPIEEDVSAPLPEGINWGKVPGSGVSGHEGRGRGGQGSGGSPQRDSWADEARRMWNDGISSVGELAAVALLYMNVDNDIDQRGMNDLPDGGGDRNQGMDDSSALDSHSSPPGGLGDDIADTIDPWLDWLEGLFDGVVGDDAAADGGLTDEQIRELISSNDDSDDSGDDSGDGTSGNSSDDDDSNDSDDDSDDNDQDDSDDSGDSDSSSDDSGDDQEEDSEETSEEGQPTGGDRGGRSGDGPSLGAQLASNLSIDLSSGRKKNQRVTGGGSGGGHISTPVSQPGKGDEHQTDSPDIQTEPEGNTVTGAGVRPVRQGESPYPGVGPNAQPGVDYEEEGPQILTNNGNPVRLNDWIIDDPRVHQ
ncbi:MAG: hypothetical protein D6B25_08125 [Desulfobulbaceae bacterium]|nr:MAG: hypothetical protein D6B25_08125 [Desulfobulbaceae bacterium]